MGSRAILTVIAVCLTAACTKKSDKEEVAIVEDDFGLYEQPLTAVNPNLEQLRYTMQAFTDESTTLDHATLAVTLDAVASALHGVPYADVGAEATEMHRVAEIVRTMGPSSVQRTESVREALKAAVAALNKAAVDPRYSVQRPLIADLARQVDALDPQQPVAKQAFQVKLAICDTANANAVKPADGMTTLPCTRLPAGSAARELSSTPRTEN
jgi:hypothetical protein